MKSRIIAAAAVAAALFVAPAHAQEVGSPDEAKALLTKALDHLGKTGAAAAYKDFSDPKGAFIDRDLYVFCLDFNGATLAHGGNPAMLGKNLKAVKDSDGKEFVGEMIKVSSEAGAGTVDYKWPNPVTKKIEAKTSYISKVPDGAFCGVGAYKK